jgi:hypothetical protein
MDLFNLRVAGFIRTIATHGATSQEWRDALAQHWPAKAPKGGGYPGARDPLDRALPDLHAAANVLLAIERTGGIPNDAERRLVIRMGARLGLSGLTAWQIYALADVYYGHFQCDHFFEKEQK